MTDPTAVLDPTPVAPAETFLERAARIFAGDIRPADYAPVPDEVREQVDRAAAEIKARNGYELSAEGRQRITNDYLTQYYGNGVGIVCERTDRGLILLAVGGEQVGPFLDRYRDWPRPGVCYEVPPPW